MLSMLLLVIAMFIVAFVCRRLFPLISLYRTIKAHYSQKGVSNSSE